jgi:lipoate-protein ligase A
MHYLDLTLDTPAENLALDEALLDAAEQATQIATADAGDQEVLRIWEPCATMVVIGSSSRLADEVNVDACKSAGVPVLRRASGGLTIVTGPGCLMYAVVLDYRKRPQLRAIDQAHQFVLGTIATALQHIIQLTTSSPSTVRHDAPQATYRLPPTIARAGISDLVLGDRKFSGNSLRCKRQHLLYHGTLLYDFKLEAISQLLKMPSRQPAYRQGRSHAEFVMNLPLDPSVLRPALVEAFDARERCPDWPHELTAHLVAEKYIRPEWNQRM